MSVWGGIKMFHSLTCKRFSKLCAAILFISEQLLAKHWMASYPKDGTPWYLQFIVNISSTEAKKSSLTIYPVPKWGCYLGTVIFTEGGRIKPSICQVQFHALHQKAMSWNVKAQWPQAFGEWILDNLEKVSTRNEQGYTLENWGVLADCISFVCKILQNSHFW